MVRASFDVILPKVSPPYNLSSYPDALLDELEAPLGNPGAEYDLQESVQLAFLAAVQLFTATPASGAHPARRRRLHSG